MDPTESIIRSMDAAFDALFPQMRPEQRAWDAAMSDEGGEIPAGEVKQPTPGAPDHAA